MTTSVIVTDHLACFFSRMRDERGSSAESEILIKVLHFESGRGPRGAMLGDTYRPASR